MPQPSPPPSTTSARTPAPPVGEPRRVSPVELDELLSRHADVRILDVRTPGEFESGHIPGAYNIPLGELPEALEELSDVSARLVVVCQSGSRADAACSTLLDAGVEGAELLQGGMAGWRGAGGSVRTTAARWDLERQVRLVAGSLVLGSILASLRVPGVRFLAGGVGGGLVLAALSNTCTMGMLLSKLPYNRPRQPSPDAATTTARHLRTSSPAPDPAVDPAEPGLTPNPNPTVR